jgi:Ca2+-binding RTX toxin-like protein
MQRVIMLLTLMAATLVLASGVALAVTKIGGPGPDTLRGTNGADNLLGNGGNDVLYALGGMDKLLGGEGKDWVLGGERRAQGGHKNLVGVPATTGF